MRTATRIKLIGVVTLLAGAVGYVFSRYGRRIRHKMREVKRRRELHERLAHVLGEKAQIEEELRQMDAEAEDSAL